jgi:Putative zinc-finger
VTDFAAEHARFAYDDAAYVLGALDPEDRRAYEQHLASCPICHESVSELAGLPAVLERVDPASLDTLDTDPVPESLLPRLLAEVGRQRRRRSLRIAAAGFLAACLLAALAFGGISIWTDSHHPQVLVMQPVSPDAAGVHATVRLLGDSTDTRIRLDCGYLGNPAGEPGYEPSYRMVVFNRAGSKVDLGSWTPQAGEDVQIVRDSPWRRQALSRIEITDTSGEVLLRLSL